MQALYLSCLLISLGMLFWLMVFDVKNSVNQFATLLLVVISNLGFYFLSISNNLEELLLAQKISYISGIFLPVFYFFLVLEICHIDIKKTVRSALLVLQCVLYGFVCSIGQNGFFYKDVGIRSKDGIYILDRTYGPVHSIYLVVIFIYLIATTGVVIYTWVKKKSVDRRNILAMLILGAIAVFAYVGEKSLNVEIEIVPIIYILLMVAAFIPIYDSSLFTVYENMDIVNEQLKEIGFLTFDKKYFYKGCDVFMEKVFPELIEYRLGQKIDDCSPELKLLINQIEKTEDLYKKVGSGHVHTTLDPIMVNDKYYSGKIHIISNAFGKLVGYTIEIRDDTEHFKTLALQERYNEELSKEVHAKTKRIRRIQQKTILGIASMVESRDLSTGGHIRRTSDVVRIFAKKLESENMGFDSRFLKLVIRSAPMHDIGKIGVDDAILRKQGKFTDEEYEAMKKHSEIGYRMVGKILSDVEEPDFVSVARNVAHYHHEKVNGTGYPSGLKGDDIPVEARIMALADVFDALVSKRCYKEAFSYDKAFNIIESEAGSHFDEKLAKVFLSCRPELEEYYNKSED